MRMFGPKKEQTLTTTEKVLELLQPVRYKPTSVDEMAEETKFSRSEVKFLYRAFKQECPNGIIDEDTFKEVYENIFPLGDASKYAHLVFKCIDKEDTGWLPQYLFNLGIQTLLEDALCGDISASDTTNKVNLGSYIKNLNKLAQLIFQEESHLETSWSFCQ